MKNTVNYTSSITGKRRSAQFNKIVSIYPRNDKDYGHYYRICITDIFYNDTQEYFIDGMLALKPDCSVTYREKVYRFKDFNRLCMAAENEHNMEAIEAL